MNRVNEDRRVVKTKRALRKALMTLMKEVAVEDITISQLCNLAQINRGTFYLHYASVEKLLEQIEEEILAQLDRVLVARLMRERAGRIGAGRSVFLELTEFAQYNADVFQVMLCGNQPWGLESQIYQRLRMEAQREWRTVAGLEGDSFEFNFQFILGGGRKVIAKWVESEFAQSARYMANLLEKITYTRMLGSGEPQRIAL